MPYDKQRSLSKAIIYFKDGNVRTFFSNDRNIRTGAIRGQLGINRLSKMIQNWGERIETAIIYNNKNGKEIAKFRNGKPVQ